MKYADENAFGHSLSIARWKPITIDRFVQALHSFACDNCDEHGNGGLAHTKSVKVDRLQTATVYYIPKEGAASRGIYSPVLLTLTNPGGKIITMEYVPEPYDYSKPLEINREEFLRDTAESPTGAI